MYLVSASVLLAIDTTLPTTFTSSDAGKLALYDALSRHVVRGTYTWPRFSSMGCDFAQTIRLRGELVADALVTLERSEKLEVENAVMKHSPSTGDVGAAERSEEFPTETADKGMKLNIYDGMYTALVPSFLTYKA
jgi:hypothetical protein